MKKALLLCLALGCAPPDVPHFIVQATGEDLGPVVDYTSLSAYNKRLDRVVEWSNVGRTLYYEGKECGGPAWLDEQAQAFPHPRDKHLYIVSPEKPSTAVVKSVLRMYRGMTSCTPDLAPQSKADVSAAYQTNEPGSPLMPQDVRVELR